MPASDPIVSQNQRHSALGRDQLCLLFGFQGLDASFPSDLTGPSGRKFDASANGEYTPGGLLRHISNVWDSA